jgi:uncharacterized protein (DUF305 family)
MKIISLAALLLVPIMAGSAHAQDSGLPPICKSEHSGHGAAAPMQMPMGEMDEAHRALMAGMGKMHAEMAEGMKAADIDVAFICGMLPHHQGAIDMARAELEYGDDPWAKELAQKVIDAQEAEIAQMREWLAKQAP